MLKPLIIILVLATGAAAQSGPHQQPAATAPAVVQPGASPLPSTWIGIGGTYDRLLPNRAQTWYSYAGLLSKESQCYSYTTADLGATQALRTGVACVVRQVGPVALLAFGQAGGASAPTGVGLSVAYGGLAVYRFRSGFTVEAGVRAVPVGGRQSTGIDIGIGFGR